MNVKKRLVVSFKNLSEELKEELKRKYPLGFQDNMIRVEKGPSDFFYAVVLEMDDVSYLIKVDVKVDDGAEEEDSDFYDEENIEGADELASDDSDDE